MHIRDELETLNTPPMVNPSAPPPTTVIADPEASGITDPVDAAAARSGQPAHRVNKDTIVLTPFGHPAMDASVWPRQIKPVSFHWTLEQLAKHWGASVTTLKAMIARREIAAVQVGRWRKVPDAERWRHERFPPMPRVAQDDSHTRTER